MYKMILLLLLMIPVSLFGISVGDSISNTAKVSYTYEGITKDLYSNTETFTIENIEGEIQFLKVINTGISSITLETIEYLDSNNNWVSLPAPTNVNLNESININYPEYYTYDDLLIIKVIDMDHNINQTQKDKLEIQLTSTAGDIEKLNLIETNIQSGIFVGYINLNHIPENGLATEQIQNGYLTVNTNDTVLAYYNNYSRNISTNIFISPDCYVFSSESGNVLPNTEVSIYEKTSNELIERRFTDSEGKFNFGHIDSGEFILKLREEENGNFFPSVYSPNELAQYSFVVDEIKSYGLPFTHYGGSLGQIDIPTDNERSDLFLEKKVNKEISSIGEIVQYTLTLTNRSTKKSSDITVEDMLPKGLKYKKGTSKINDVKTIPTISKDGRILTFLIDEIDAQEEIKIKFIAEITSLADEHKIINQATFYGPTVANSNVATAATLMKEELFKSTGFIFGKVYTCDDKIGVQNVKLYMQNGIYILTDEEGKFHIEGIENGTHVIQIDKDKLPKGYEVGTLKENAKFAGKNFSRFVNLERGGLKKVEFCLNKVEVKESKNDFKIEETEVEKMPDYEVKDLIENEGQMKILWPPNNFLPDVLSTKIAVVYDKKYTIKGFINNEKIDMIHFDGKLTDIKTNTVIDTFRGLDLKERENIIKFQFYDGEKIIKTITKKVIFAGKPFNIEYVKEKSFSVADGKNNPVIALRFTDDKGIPLRKGMTGDFEINLPYKAKKDGFASLNRYEVLSDGIAYITLEPTEQAGDVKLEFKIDEKVHSVDARLKADPRDWIIVGFGEGMVGYNKVKDHIESTDSTEIVKKGRISFFAKGIIKGEWLLKLGYDSGKDTENTVLFDKIDPNRYYTLYNDKSSQEYEASSREKLFVKLEKDNFNAMFGDFQTDIAKGKLTEYTRRTTGLKAEYKDDNYEAVYFATNTEHLFMRDEIQGDGTSGVYYLKGQEIELNSEVIEIQVRDRYKPEIILETRTLARYRDYSIDYERGAIYFKEPIYSTDKDFNPQYIIAEYEVKTDGKRNLTHGGRGLYKKDDLKVGGTFISEDADNINRMMYGVDAEYDINKKFKIKGEYAKTDIDADTQYSGTAKAFELEYKDNNTTIESYYREQDNAFGLNQLNETLGGTRKIGIDVKQRISENKEIITSGYRDENLLDNSIRDIFELKGRYFEKDWSVFTGGRYLDSPNVGQINQLLIGGEKSFLKNKLKALLEYDHTLSNKEDSVYPTRLKTRLDYNLDQNTSLFTSIEFMKDRENRFQTGVEHKAWKGMTMKNMTVNEIKEDTSRLYNVYNLRQDYKLNEQWSFSVGYENGEMLDNNNFISDGKDKFNAYNAGAEYTKDKFGIASSIEYRDSLIEEKYNFIANSYKKVNEGFAFGLSAGLNLLDNTTIGSERNDGRLIGSFVYRPDNSKWMVLNKTDLVYEKEKSEYQEFDTAKFINNMHLNYEYSNETEISFQHGFKYVRDAIEDYEHNGLNQLIGVDISHDLNEKIELGIQGSTLYSHSADVYEYNAGIYGNYNVYTNILIGIGYNFIGFEDEDYDLQSYHKKGPYIQFRMKFDQEDVKEIIKGTQQQQ